MSLPRGCPGGLYFCGTETGFSVSELMEEARFPVSVDSSAACDPLESRSLAAFVGAKEMFLQKAQDKD